MVTPATRRSINSSTRDGQLQTPMQQQVQSPQHIVRPVASVEEARAVQTDFSGALTIMPDTAHGAIYTKQLNLQTGCADFVMYRRAQEPETNKPPGIDYVWIMFREQNSTSLSDGLTSYVNNWEVRKRW